MTISTITTQDIIPTATKAVEMFTKVSSNDMIMPAFGTHYSKEDLVMDTVEKVVRGNPSYLTKSYVYLAARCACINQLNKKKVSFIPPERKDPAGEQLDPVETLEFDAYNHVGDLEESILDYLGPLETQVYFGLVSRRLYVEIAEDLGISMSSLERAVRDLKYKLYYILKEEDPENHR